MLRVGMETLTLVAIGIVCHSAVRPPNRAKDPACHRCGGDRADGPWRLARRSPRRAHADWRVCPFNLRTAEWAHFDLEKAEWRIPAEVMKREDLIVPLSRQALQILREVYSLTGDGRFVFPGMFDRSRPMSENTINGAFRRLGYGGDEFTGHGFRAMARTIMDEVLEYRVEWIEMQLAHAVKDPNGRAYNRTAFFAQRKAVMQGWSDYLDSLRSGQTKGCEARRTA